MLFFQKDVDLAPYTTFGVQAFAKEFVSISSLTDLEELVLTNALKDKKHLVLGGGSNVLFTKDFDGLVIKLDLKGKSIWEDEGHFYINAMAGEEWDDLVQYALSHHAYGAENLSLIPGTCGAAPMQNIGAYGVELNDIFHKLNALHIPTGKYRIFNHSDCQFGYRESVFKKSLKGQYIITEIELKLTKKPILKLDYGAIQQVLDEQGIHSPNPTDVAKVVSEIRMAKLPDPKTIGNGGSFFKNPIISTSQFRDLETQFGEIPHYNVSSTEVKIPAAWLIDKCGWKGKRINNVGVHEHQALVLVNYGGGKGNEILALSQKVQKSVLDQYGIELHPEINIY